MIPIASGVRIWIATGHTDMRRGMHGLARQVQEGLGRDPFAGDVFVFRGRDPAGSAFRATGHPYTTGFFVLACALVVMATLFSNPRNSLIGFAILAAGIPACLYWQRKNKAPA